MHGFKWNVLIFTQEVVYRVEEVAESNEEDVAFIDGHGNVIEDEEENNDYESEEEENNSEYESEEKDSN